MNSVNYFFSNYWKVSLKKWPISVLIILLILICTHAYKNPFHEDKKVNEIKLLSVIVDSVENKQRNQYLVNTLLQHLAFASDSELSEKDARVQSRLFYVTILVALFSFLYKRNKGV